MFIKKWDSPVVENTESVMLSCTNCGNECKHDIRRVHGIGVGIIFLKEPLISIKKYYLVCSVCGHMAQELSKTQVTAHKKK